ncbi:MAG: glycosyltransferase family 4 protein [Actinobacteria bacterium]|nr:glycosyltransferase family 4 protein [Actinomycetota bacterium]
MKIALVCPYAWEEPGGVRVHVRELGERLRERGHDVLALAPARGRPEQAWVRGVGAPLSVRFGGSFAPISPWPSTRRRVRRALADLGPDVVHVHEPFAPSASFFALRWGGAPVVATFHSGVDRSRLYDLAGPALRRAARGIAVRVAVSERAAEVVRRRAGGAYRVIPNGVDVARFAGAAPADLGPGRKVLFVGRLHPRKGFATAVEAFRRLGADHADLRLVVAGDGRELAAVANLPPELRRRVVLLGAVANRDLPPIHAACDAFMAPNTGGESFGVVLAEAMAAGLPVVASDIPGYDEVVTDAIDGLLVPPGDAAALAAALGRLLDDPALAERLREAGRHRAARFDWPLVVEEIEEAYRDAVASGPPRLR